ncbi:GTPase domain-containing protein [Geomonas paludis]|uniref:GTP-binding protein n=1 Tax=Geomonas paludis TaxID=2740185 RepID=A0A6V8MUP9_9BACT|nr:GTPase domain-containing protein [Geomonas paludis]UPU38035.1 GTPase domain-containing protein [Geomonas paludis]GFO63437.1 GTP-binding protein [Geomonas paludis]
MALVNQAKREINAKIVFFGPGQAGKGTSLRHVFNKLKPEFRGALKVMSVQGARMLFFDFTPPGDGNVDGFRVRFHLYTVSGPLVDPAAWKMVLKGADGVVFVADSAPQRLADNQAALGQLVEYLKGYGQSLTTMPTILQYNKSDLADAAALAELEQQLNPSRLVSFKTSSHTGEGVLQGLMALVKSILTGLRAKGTDAIASSEGLQQMVEPPAAAARPAVEPPAAPAPARPAAAAVPEPPVAPVTPSAPAAPEEAPLSLEIAGDPVATGDVVRVPLTIRSGDREKTVVLTLSLGLSEE